MRAVESVLLRSVNDSGGRAPAVVIVSAGMPRATNGPWPYSVNGNPRSISWATTLGRPGGRPACSSIRRDAVCDEARRRRARRVARDLDPRRAAPTDRVEVDRRDDGERRMRREAQRAETAERAARPSRGTRSCARTARASRASSRARSRGRARRARPSRSRCRSRRCRRRRRRGAPSRRSPGATARARPPTGSAAASGRAPGSSPSRCPTRRAGRTAASGRGTTRRPRSEPAPPGERSG